ncbi:putative zinc-type alcohol dehydrogenase [Dioszegia hungarica]|uniref:alcohol dehydrogenase (NADP(+)) n=1 Tax=Dioszegia hungarica TaxID=4972 RepID=A0AA38LTU2_9TREE|nr:putative zinc-type alcohol dehydrogenase [Dioszegia hungarica]XP_052944785.1 putative zinc-type alcohol dehydrogenase [Dioszegia hungarica]KAI9635001.1 putative zinc-type alcohol dehydrogenase [Dioszegia hungarica]KAI9635008.1 putative zinc-type alcohol dehydrogenase [Dioszegia hungarica]
MSVTHATGYAVFDPKDYLNFKLQKYELEPSADDRVTVAVECCGVCGSDHHTISGGWGPWETKFVVTGHEVIGKVVEVGKAVKEFKVGQRVGVGAQVGSCGKCKACKTGLENYCVQPVHGYNTKWYDNKEHQGGYSTHVRAQELFVFPIPEGLKSTDAASMMCAGITTFSPLVRNGAGPGKKVGVVGLGGLGHYAVLFGKALGAEVTVFSRSDAKKADALKMGADRFIATENKGFEKDLKRDLDLIIITASSSSLPLDELLSCLDIEKKCVFVGMPEEGLSNVRSQTLSDNAVSLSSSHLGNNAELRQMLQLAADKGIKPWVTVMPMKDAAKAIKAVEDNSVRYRSVLTQDIEA